MEQDGGRTGRALSLIVAGNAATDMAGTVRSALLELEPEADIAIRSPDQVDAETRKSVDPMAVTALVLSIPSAIVALMDIVDRIEKRRRAAEVLERLQLAQRKEPSVRLHLVLPDGPRNVDDIDTTTLLALAEGSGKE
jgi:hypothetical protein